MGRLAQQQPSERELKDQAHALSLKGKYDDAAAVYRALLRLSARDSGLHLNIAEVYRKRGRLDEAVESYQEAARLLASAGHVARARAALACALQLAPGEPVLVGALARLDPAPVPRRLALVPPPVPDEEEVLETGFDDVSDEPMTDPFCPLFDWLGEGPDAAPQQLVPPTTVWSRPGRRPGS